MRRWLAPLGFTLWIFVCGTIVETIPVLAVSRSQAECVWIGDRLYCPCQDDYCDPDPEFCFPVEEEWYCPEPHHHAE